MRALLAALGAALFLTGCSLEPPYGRPAAPIPDHYPDAARPTADGATTARRATPWCAGFPDPRIGRLVAVALDHNRDVKLAAARVEEARALYGVQSSARLPTISAEASSTSPPRGNETAQQIGLALAAYELDFFGKMKNLSDAALHEYMATEQARRTARLSVTAEVIRAYVRELADTARVALARRVIVSRKAGSALMDRRRAAGVSSPLEVRQVRSLVAAAESDLVEQELALARARNALALLTGYADPDPPVSGTTSGTTSGFAAFEAGWGGVEAGLPSELLTARPDIMAAEQRLMAANAGIGAVRAAFFPSIRLTAAGGLASEELRSLFRIGSGALQVGPQISLPLFDGGRNQANLDLARARESVAVIDYERAIQIAFREVSDALAGQSLLDRDVQGRMAMRDLEEERRTLAMKRYLAGAVGYLDVLDADRGLFDAERGVLEARRARLENAVGLFRALGGCPPPA